MALALLSQHESVGVLRRLSMYRSAHILYLRKKACCVWLGAAQDVHVGQRSAAFSRFIIHKRLLAFFMYFNSHTPTIFISIRLFLLYLYLSFSLRCCSSSLAFGPIIFIIDRCFYYIFINTYFLPVNVFSFLQANAGRIWYLYHAKVISNIYTYTRKKITAIKCSTAFVPQVHCSRSTRQTFAVKVAYVWILHKTTDVIAITHEICKRALTLHASLNLKLTRTKRLTCLLRVDVF